MMLKLFTPAHVRLLPALAVLLFAAPANSLAADSTTYTNDFENTELNSIPDDMMVLAGDFTVQSDGTNHFLELPGAPLDSFAVQFGPMGNEMTVSGRIYATKRGRRMPTFGIGLGGVSGWKLQVAPAKNVIELLLDLDSRVSAPYDWKSGEWLKLQLTIAPNSDATWKIEGKVWTAEKPESTATVVSFQAKEEPISGRASILASPFSGTPIQFDDLKVGPTTK